MDAFFPVLGLGLARGALKNKAAAAKRKVAAAAPEMKGLFRDAAKAPQQDPVQFEDAAAPGQFNDDTGGGAYSDPGFTDPANGSSSTGQPEPVVAPSGAPVPPTFPPPDPPRRAVSKEDRLMMENSMTSKNLLVAMYVLTEQFGLAKTSDVHRAEIEKSVPDKAAAAKDARHNYTDLMLQECVRGLFAADVYVKIIRIRLTQLAESMDVTTSASSQQAAPAADSALSKEDADKVEGFAVIMVELLTALHLHLRLGDGDWDTRDGQRRVVDDAWQKVLTDMTTVLQGISKAAEAGLFGQIELPAGKMQDKCLDILDYQRTLKAEVLAKQSARTALMGQKTEYEKQLNQIRRKKDDVDQNLAEVQATISRLEESGMSLTDADKRAIDVLKSVAQLDKKTQVNINSFMKTATGSVSEWATNMWMSWPTKK